MNRLCTICARGGSQGVKGKNLKQIKGYSLLEISILQAKKSNLFKWIAVSSDSEAILNEARRVGADFVIQRPDELASHTAGKLPAIQHCVQKVEELSGSSFAVVVDLDVTSPLRLVEDIKGAVNLLENSNGLENVITGAPSRRSPYFNLVEEVEDGYVKVSKQNSNAILRRQDAPKCYDMNASVYVWRREALFINSKLNFGKTKIFAMPEERSLDIDSELDFEIVKFLADKFGRFEREW